MAVVVAKKTDETDIYFSYISQKSETAYTAGRKRLRFWKERIQVLVRRHIRAMTIRVGDLPSAIRGRPIAG